MDARRQRLASASLYLIVSARQLDAAAAALGAGADVVQLRDKDADDADLVAGGRALRDMCDRAGALLIVNDSADLALACAADGVHVGQDDEPVASVRDRADLIVGVSTHTPAQIGAADAAGADYLGVGPVYATPTKPGVEPVGVELVRAACALTDKPFFAIGGIDAGRVAAVAGAGARRVAVVRAIADAADPAAATRELVAALEGAAAVAR